MGNPRIIKLDMPLTVTSSTFGEAFGEYSELKGRGRARRRKRRQERRMARINDRGERKRAKQGIRAEQQEARQMRKDTRKSRRVARGEMGNEEEGAESTENGGSEPIGDEEQGQPTEQEGAGQDETETTEESDVQAGEQDAIDEESGVDGYYDSFDAEMSSADGIEYDNLGSTEDIYALQDDDFYSYIDESSSADGFQKTTVKKRIGKGTKDVALKSEWNKEMVSRLKKKVRAIDRILADPQTSPEKRNMLGIRRAKMIEAITLHKDRAVSFDGLMNDYVNAEGEYSGIDGDTSDADGDYENADGETSDASGKRKRKKTSPSKARRKAEVKAAQREARKKRQKARIAAKKKKGTTTKVSKSLDPAFNKNLIVIPAKEVSGASSAEGETGLIALDDINDFDAPTENEYSMASGNTLKNVNWKDVLIGVAIAGLAIYGAKKAKLF
jgi:hypothetical protein